MPEYKPHKVNVSDSQKDKIRQAIENHEAVSIRFKHEDLVGEDLLVFTTQQINRIAKAFSEGKGLTIKFSKTQLQHNKVVEGGFIGSLMGLARIAGPMIAKTLGLGALGGLASSGVNALVGGNGLTLSKRGGSGLFLKKGGCLSCVEIKGDGLYLSPRRMYDDFKLRGNGLYLTDGANYQKVGKGILLGPNSPFKDIPLLNILL